MGLSFSKAPVIRITATELRFFDGARLRGTEKFSRSAVQCLEVHTSLGMSSIEVHLRNERSRLLPIGAIWPTRRLTAFIDGFNASRS